MSKSIWIDSKGREFLDDTDENELPVVYYTTKSNNINFKIGDEVILKNYDNEKGVITSTDYCILVLLKDGCLGRENDKYKVIKTGNTYPEIKRILDNLGNEF